MNKKGSIGLLLMLIGAASLISTNILWVLVGKDTVPPSVTPEMPFDKSIASTPLSFLSDRKYICSATDSGSGILFVEYMDDVLEEYNPVTLASVGNDRYEGSFPSGVTYAAKTNYNFEFKALDKAGNSKLVTGVFYLYDSLVGDWYVNNVKIVSPTQEIWVRTNSIVFKFVKSTGVADSYISCSLSGGVVAPLTKVAAGTWEGTFTLDDGVYNIDMIAADGTSQIMMSILGLQVGEDQPSGDDGSDDDALTENLAYLFSFGLMGLGFTLWWSGRKAAN